MATIAEVLALLDKGTAVYATGTATLTGLEGQVKALDPKLTTTATQLTTLENQINTVIGNTDNAAYKATSAIFNAVDTLTPKEFEEYINSPNLKAWEAANKAYKDAVDGAKYEAGRQALALNYYGTNSKTTVTEEPVPADPVTPSENNPVAKPATTTDPTSTPGSPLPPTSELKIEPVPVTVDAPLLDKNGKVIGSQPLVLIDKPLIPDPGELKIDPIDIGELNVEVPDLNTIPPAIGLSSGITTAASAATALDQQQFTAQADWRVRLALSPGANYLYKAKPPGILQPLADTDGVIFPYTPTISVSYSASYEQTAMTHTNYTVHQYSKSSVDQLTITCEFTAQDTKEANYVLAVIHFFKSMTKMFYGKDDDPIRGTPPPLCYIYGMGGYQFDALPLAISSFNYSLPTDVDYIKTMAPSAAGTPQPTVATPATNSSNPSAERLGPSAAPGGKPAPPSYGETPTSVSESPTWVPTKIQLSITCLPIMSRNQISNNFSLKDYATGNLVLGTRQGRLGGGFW